MIDDTAMTVLRSISGASAITLEGGYAVFVGPAALERNGERVLFEPARMSQVKRNESGRCTHTVATYKDGSSLTFTWNPARGPRYAHRQPPRAAA